ncbi:transglycosylase SLT domain-containing protein [Streptomyces sp. NPDC053431]|uniref:transglycosylase SLT domain-containing protein n=1 Tax=Streptomyces sp. NPDC053431 TaxID=3365703 RepID=UPI0037CDBED9
MRKVEGSWRYIARASRRLIIMLAGAGVAVGMTLSAASPAAATPASKMRLKGWINHSLDVMRAHHIPGSYEGIYRNLMRESSGNLYAINLWDSNARAGIPSKGLMQVIEPTFRAYHVRGTSWDIFDPIANITAACNYAAHRYGSIDNVNGPY